MRPVVAALEALPPLGAAWRQLVAFAAGYYQRGLGEVALAVLPPELRRLDEAALGRRLARRAKAADRATGRRQAAAAAGGGGAADARDAADAASAAGATGPAHATGAAGATSAANPAGPAAAPAPGAGPAPPVPACNAPEPSPEQQAVLERLRALAAADGAPPAVLLYGSTGSGKTEVYLRAAAEALARGRQVLVLVPEINLTPQLEARFAARFAGHRLVALHSALTPAQRLRHWLDAHLGEADLVLGTRLAIFASLPRLGLLVVDEEHDPSYKQQEGARYSARDLAVYRGRLERVPVLLGSATPSLETWQHAQTGRYLRLDMPTRIGRAPLPAVRLVDMTQIARRAGGTVLAPALLAALHERLARGEQSLLFLNRRGYAPVLQCGDCAWRSGCPHCSAWRVFHKLDRTLRCHHCGLSERVPRACPDCGNPDITPVGRGTERLEEQLAGLLHHPDGRPARVARIDADSTRGTGVLQARLGAVHDGEVDVLVGTQMIAKGHDFRRVTLVAAVNPDTGLFSSDFRAPERLFALLMQAAGRAGRDAARAGRAEMWLQTWQPQHALYAALVRHDYPAFAAAQLAERRSAGLPPFSHLALLRAEARDAAAATGFLDAAAALAPTLPDAPALLDGVLIYPPVPTAVARVADVERVQMLVEAGSRARLQRLLAAWLPALHALRRERAGPGQRILRWAVDVDPMEI
ncbi:primosomal protein N' [Piscinibacter sakaiensis]|uniref:primosomal protein N' n=1 Tax=Piscinibacter sakaiensis TaxID=1547922 RepID=UPI003F7700FE